MAGIVESDDITALIIEMEKAADYWQKVRAGFETEHTSGVE